MKILTLFILSSISILTISCTKPVKSVLPPDFGTVIEVPNEINTIQEAIDTAKSFDTILIHPGVYYESNLIIKKPLYITSEYSDNSDSLIIKQTIINGGQISKVFYISDVSDTIRMNGFTITEGFAKENITIENSYYGGGIFISNSNVKLSNIILVKNSASAPTSRGSGGGLFIYNSYASIYNSFINDNYALRTGGAFYCEKSILKIHDSEIIENSSWWGGAPISIYSSAIDFKNVLMQNNLNNYDLTHYPEIYIYACTGTFENVSIISDSIHIENSQLAFRP
jgi:hypothetical protein